jgi:trehalose 6-phosphate phosphatase
MKPFIADAQTWALFVDFDGTLVEIAERPDEVRVDAALAGTLIRLRDRLGGALAVITGREIATIDRFLAPYQFDVAGLHGVEQRLGGKLASCRPEDHPNLRRAVEVLKRLLASEPGILIEDKGCSVAVHWRLAPQRAEAIIHIVQGIADNLGPDYRLQSGKALAEIVPHGAAKGAAIERFLDHAPYRGRLPIFIGDDETDEHGFAAVKARNGVSIKVGSGPTDASWRLATPPAVRERLAAWAAGAPLASLGGS